MTFTLYITLVSIFFLNAEAARILAICPTPSLSHQVIFYPIVKELARRGHDITFITTNPAYPDGGAPENLREIDLKNLSYALWKKYFTVSEFGKDNFVYKGSRVIVEVIPKVYEEQMKDSSIQSLIKAERNFDLLLLQAWFRPAMVWSHIYKVPVIKVSSIGMAYDNPENFGAPVHPILYPGCMHQRIYNLTFFEIFTELYKRYYVEKTYIDNEEEENEIVKRIFGPDVPPLSELQKNAHMLMLNINSFWDRNRPLPRNVVYFGQVHQKPVKDLPEDIQTFMKPSGVIYMSFGTNVPPSQLPPATIQMFLRVFSRLPYRILWKFDLDELEGKPDNVMIRKWFPQSDIFRHPNLKLIITQGGLQTIEEAIQVGVPLLGIPMLADQWLNVEHCVQFGFGEQLEMETIDEEQFLGSIMKVIEDPSFRENILKFRTLIHDTKSTSLDRAISWIEYVLKHSGTMHLRAPAANMPWTEYFEIELIITVISMIVIFLVSLWYILKLLFKKIQEIVDAQVTTNEN